MGPFVERVTEWHLAKGQQSLEEAEALQRRHRLPERDTGLQAQYPDRRLGPRQWAPYSQPVRATYEREEDCQLTEIPKRRPKMAKQPEYDMTADVEINEDEFFTTVTPELTETMNEETKAASTGSGTAYFKWDPSKQAHYLRLLPAPKSWGNLFFVQRRHWVTTPEGKRLPVPCIAHLGQDCIGCATTNEVGNLPGGAELQDGMKTQVGFLYNVIDVESAEAKAALAEGRMPPILVYTAPKSAHEGIQAALAEGHDLLSIDGGLPIKITKTVKNGNTRYQVQTAAANKKWPIERAWLPAQPQLPVLANPVSLSDTEALEKLTTTWGEIRGALGLGGRGETKALPPMRHSRGPSSGLGKRLNG